MAKRGPRPIDLSMTVCPHCKHSTHTGIHGGCRECLKVKATADGKRMPFTPVTAKDIAA